MATQAVARPVRFTRSEVLLAVFLLLVFGLAGKFLLHYAFPYFRFDPAYFDYYWPHRFRLITHISGGILALVCGPFQFWTGLRQKALNIHRWTGLLYLLGVLIGSSGAGMMAYFSTPRNFGVSLGFMALAWILTTSVAYLAIRRRLVPLHKEWMVRSYIIAFGFVTFRLVNDYPPAMHWGTFEDRGATLAWGCWVVPLLAYEIILAVRRVLAVKPA